MKMTGNFVGLSLRDVMTMLGSVKKDGCLSISNETKGGEIIFSDGKIVSVAVEGDPGWADVLFNKGLVGEDIFSENNRKDPSLRESLKQRLSTQAETVDLISKFFVDEIYSVISVSDVSYQFEVCEVSDVFTSGIAVGVEEILAGIDRCEEEWRRVYQVIPSLESYVDLVETGIDGEIVLTSDEWRIIVKLREPRIIEELKLQLGLPVLLLCKKLIDMKARGLIKFIKTDSQEFAEIENNKGKYIKNSKSKTMPLEWSSYYEQLDDKSNDKKGKAKIAN